LLFGTCEGEIVFLSPSIFLQTKIFSTWAEVIKKPKKEKSLRVLSVNPDPPEERKIPKRKKGSNWLHSQQAILLDCYEKNNQINNVTI